MDIVNYQFQIGPYTYNVCVSENLIAVSYGDAGWTVSRLQDPEDFNKGIRALNFGRVSGNYKPFEDWLIGAEKTDEDESSYRWLIEEGIIGDEEITGVFHGDQ